MGEVETRLAATPLQLTQENLICRIHIFGLLFYSGSLWAHFVMTSASAHRTFCQLLAYLKLPLISRVQCSAAALECSMLGEIGILSRELW